MAPNPADHRRGPGLVDREAGLSDESVQILPGIIRGDNGSGATNVINELLQPTGSTSIAARSRLCYQLEVRYKRSRNNNRPVSRTHGLGATDLDGRAFVDPTQELRFLTAPDHGRFVRCRRQAGSRCQAA